jgi:hypothetical protein
VAANYVGKWNGSSWSGLGSGINRDVLALTVFDDGSGSALYAGGRFITAGGVKANRIAKWNGTSWSALGSGMNVNDEYVSALTVFDDGSGPALYAGGWFMAAGGVAANRIAKWNGTSWSALGSGMSGSVSALTVFDDGSGPALYAGGNFGSAGGVAVKSIAKWDGTSWSAPGSAIVQDVHALTVFDDGSGPALYAGGWFQSAGGFGVLPIAKWDGTSWSALGSGTNNTVWALTVFDDGSGPALHVGGEFTTAGGVAANYIAKWDGSGWSALGSGVGQAPNSNGVNALTVFDDGSGPALYAGGYFTTAGGVAANNIAKWNGTSWSALGSGVYGRVLALTGFGDGSGPGLYAGGSFFFSPSSPSGDCYLAKWGCASPPPTSYCTAGTSASGCQAAISAAGTASASALSGFSLLATGVEGSKDGLFFFGTNGQQANPWGNGTSYRCVVPPVKHAGHLTGAGTNGACDGAFAQDLNAHWCPTCPKPNKNPGAAAVVRAQLWYRDPQSTSNQTTSLSDAIEFVVGL